MIMSNSSGISLYASSLAGEVVSHVLDRRWGGRPGVMGANSGFQCLQVVLDIGW